MKKCRNLSTAVIHNMYSAGTAIQLRKSGEWNKMHNEKLCVSSDCLRDRDKVVEYNVLFLLALNK
jgi:hypothetical protein